MANPSKEAAEAWRHIEADADFQAAPLDQRKEARRLWRQEYGLDKPAAKQSPAQMMAEAQDPAAMARKHGPLQQPKGAPYIVPKIIDPQATPPGLQYSGPKPQVLRQDGMPIKPPVTPITESFPGMPGRAINAAATGLDKSQLGSVSRLSGNGGLFPEGGLAPLEGGLEQFGAGLMQMAGDAFPLGLAGGTLSAPARGALMLGGPSTLRNAAGYQSGDVLPQDVLPNIASDAFQGAFGGVIAQKMPGAGVQNLTRNAVQNAGQAAIGAAMTGQAPDLTQLGANTAFNMLLDAAVPGNMPNRQQVADFAAKPLPLGDLSQQRGSIGFMEPIWKGKRRADPPAPGKTYYHIVPDDYRPGDDIYSYDAYADKYGEPRPWKWEEAPEGFDGDTVSLHDNLPEAREFAAEYGGRILEVKLPDSLDDVGIRGGVNSEGYPFIMNKIPNQLVRELPMREGERGSFNPLDLFRRNRQSDAEVPGGVAPVRDAAGKLVDQVNDAMNQQGDQPAPPRPPAAPQADAGQVPPVRPPDVSAPAAPPPPPPRPTGTVAPGDSAPIPQQPAGPAPTGMVGNDKTQAAFTPAVKRVYGVDAENLSGEAAQTIKQVADVLDDPARPLVTQESVAAAREKVENGDYFNWRRSGLSGDAQEAMAQRLAEVVAENKLNPKQSVTFREIEAEAKAIDPELLRHLAKPKKGETLNPVVRLAARDNLNGINAKIVELTKDYDANARNWSEAERQQAREVIARMDNDAKRLLDVLIPTRSQDGRNLAFHAIMAKQSFDAEYWFARARRAAGSEQLPDPVNQRIRDLTVAGKKAQDAGDEAGMRAARIAIAKELSKLEKSTGLQVFSAAVKAGLLTGPRTTMRNVSSNIMFGALEEISRLPSSIVDIALSGITKQRTVGGVDPIAMARATGSAATSGVREAIEVMRNGASDNDLARFELPREIVSGNRLLDGYINGVFRFLGAQDRMAKSYAIRRSLEEQASLMARAERKAGTLPQGMSEAMRRTQLVAKPDDVMVARAMGDAEVATFQNDNVISTAYQGGRKAATSTSSPILNAGGDFLNTAADLVMPFTKTPLNVLARTLDYTAGISATYKAPIAAYKRVANRDAGTSRAKALFAKLSPEEQRGIAIAMGRGSVGAGILYLGYKLAEHGLMTGMPEKDEQGRKGTMGVANEGIGSVKVGDSWLQVTGFAPFGALMVTGASLFEQGNRELKDVAKRPGKLAAVAMKGIREMPFLTGAKNIMETFESPDTKFGRFTGGIGRMLVPTLVGDVAGTMDDRLRAPGDFFEGIQSQIPGARNLLPERVNAFGEARPQPSMFDPFNSKQASRDPLIQEMQRVGANIVPQRPVINVGIETTDGRQMKVPVQLQANENVALQRAAGDYMKQTMAELKDEWDADPSLTDADRKADIEKAWTDAKKFARMDFMDKAEALMQKRAMQQITAGHGEFLENQPQTAEPGEASAGSFF